MNEHRLPPYKKLIHIAPYLNFAGVTVIGFGILGGWAGAAWPWVLAIFLIRFPVSILFFWMGKKWNTYRGSIIIFAVSNFVTTIAIVILTGVTPNIFWLLFILEAVAAAMFRSPQGIIFYSLCVLIFMVYSQVAHGFNLPDLASGLVIASLSFFIGFITYKAMSMLYAEHEIVQLVEAKKIINELRLKRITDNMLDLIIEINEEGNIVYVCPSIHDILGYSSEDLYGHFIGELVHPEDTQNIKANNFNEQPLEEPIKIEVRLQHIKGHYLWFEWIENPLVEYEKTIGVIISGRDITQRKLAQTRLSESEEMFSKAFQLNPQPMTISDFNTGNYLDCNQAFLSSTGFSREEMVGHKVVKTGLFFNSDQQRVISEKIFKGERFYRLESDIRTKKGEIRYGLISGETIYLGDQRLILTVTEDITEHRNADLALKESENRYRIIFEGASEGIIVINMDHQKIQYVNPIMCSMFGYLEDEFQNITYQELFSSQPEQASSNNIIMDDEKDTTGIPAVIQCKRKDGSLFYADVRSSYSRLDGEKIIIGFFNDISDRWRNDNLLQARLTLGNLSPHKSIDELLQTTLDLIEKITDSQIGFFRFMDNNENLPYKRTWSSNTHRIYNPANIVNRSLSIQEAGLWAECFETKEPTICNHYQDLNNRKTLPPGHPAITRFISVPVERGGRVMAIAGVGNKRSDYDSKDAEVVLLLAGEAWDLVSKKKAEIAQRESEEKYRGLLECQESAIFTLDKMGFFHYINRIAADAMGKKPEEMIGHSIKEYFPPQIYEYQMEKLTQVFDSGVGSVDESQMILNGQPFWYRTTIQPLRDTSGSIHTAMLIAVDITEHKDIELVLEEKVKARTAEIEAVRQRLELATKAAKVGIWDWDIKTNQLKWDEQMFRIYNISPHQFHPTVEDWEKMVHPDDLVNDKEMISTAIKKGKEYDNELRIYWPDHSEHYIKSNAIILRDENNSPVRMIGIEYDITNRKQVENMLHASEEMLRMANHELEQAVRMKDEFLASMSHELRTPLTSILGLSEALQLNVYGDLNKKQKDVLNNVQISGHHLLDLINDILDVSKIEAGKLDLQMDMCNLSQICQSSLRMVKGMAQKKNIHITYVMEPEKIDFYGDERRVKQIQVNLLSNAIKFTPEGGSVGLEVIADRQNMTIKISVWDTGIGINSKDLSSLFQPFVQIDSSLSRQQSGTGLGLVLIKRLTELHDGTVHVDSKPGEGSRFSIIIPWKEKAPSVKNQEHRMDGKKKNAPPLIDHPPKKENKVPGLYHSVPTIMLVDDNQGNRGVIADYLETMNFRVVQIKNGIEFLEKAPVTQPDVILMDIQMPGLNGLEAIRKIRSVSDQKIASTPIIALTALVMDGDIQRCLEAGANAYISKPVNLIDLLNTIYKVLNQVQ